MNKAPSTSLGVRWWHWTTVAGLTLVVGATALSSTTSDAWWIRALDFPRQQLAVVLATLLVATVRWWRGGHWPLRVLWLAGVAALVAQLVWIAPYTGLVDVDMAVADACTPDARVRILVANVRYENDDSAALRELVEQASPDVVLVTEPGRWWERELAPIERRLPHVIRQPQEDTWGMLLYSRLPLIEPEVRFLVEPDIPSMRTRLQLDSGDQIWLYAMHPRPPVPGQDTDERDTELVMVGKELRTRGAPPILTGDLNDVAWSATTGQLLDIGDLRDPRIGRGPFSTFDATMPSWLRWPLDYVFFTEHFELCRLQLLGDIGSDHVPLLAEAVLRGKP